MLTLVTLKRYSIEILFGFALAAILFDRFRFAGRIGIGEILLALTVYLSLYLILLDYKRLKFDNVGIWYAVSINLFLLLCMLPNTLWHVFFLPHNGSSLLEISAYTSCFLFILTIALLKLNHNVIGAIAITIVFFISFAFLGDPESWYGDVRFSGASDNPNRLAIYLLSSLVILSQLNIDKFKKFLCFLAFTTFIYITLSDAARLGFAALVLSFLFFQGFRSPYILPIYILLAFFALIFIATNLNAIADGLSTLWYAASNSSFRFNLMSNGIQAWLEHPASILIGHGSGAFSGYMGPYEGWESHSNPADLLSIAGIAGFLLFYLPLLYSIILFIQKRNHFAASALIGLLIFSLFAFIARHPVVWFAIYCSLMNSRISQEKI